MVTRRICLFLLIVAAAAAIGCSKTEEKRYPMTGEIKAIDPAAKTATIAAGKIGDWMDAMTMEYSIKPDTDFAKLHVGDHIQATVVVKDPTYYVTDITVTAPAQGK
jgi:Cu/Ag efflux protein CusF